MEARLVLEYGIRWSKETNETTAKILGYNDDRYGFGYWNPSTLCETVWDA